MSTEEQRQDFVDNAVHELLQKLAPPGTKVPWDICMIGNVRDAIEDEFEVAHIATSDQFYPGVPQPPCDECGAVEPTQNPGDSLVGAWHMDSCSLHPNNVENKS